MRSHAERGNEKNPNHDAKKFGVRRTRSGGLR
jgi:hypothetical protein